MERRILIGAFVGTMAVIVAVAVFIASRVQTEKELLESSIVEAQRGRDINTYAGLHAYALGDESPGVLLYDYADEAVVEVSGFGEAYDGVFSGYGEIRTVWEKLFRRGDFLKATKASVETTGASSFMVLVENISFPATGGIVTSIVDELTMDARGNIMREFVRPEKIIVPKPVPVAPSDETGTAPIPGAN